MSADKSSAGTAQTKPVTYQSAYPGSMFKEVDGGYVEREDNASLAAALLENIAALQRRAEDAEDAEKALKKAVAVNAQLLEALRACLPFIDDASDVHSVFAESAASTSCRAAVQGAHAAIAAAEAA